MTVVARRETGPPPVPRPEPGPKPDPEPQPGSDPDLIPPTETEPEPDVVPQPTPEPEPMPSLAKLVRRAAVDSAVRDRNRLLTSTMMLRLCRLLKNCLRASFTGVDFGASVMLIEDWQPPDSRLSENSQSYRIGGNERQENIQSCGHRAETLFRAHELPSTAPSATSATADLRLAAL